MADYKVVKIDPLATRKWGEGSKKTYYIKTALADPATNTPHPKAVSIGKKSPDTLKVGDIVHGTITETQYETDKFTADVAAAGNWRPTRDEDAIRAQFAIKTAVELLRDPSREVPEITIEYWAKVFYLMVEKVKGTTIWPPELQSGYKKATVQSSTLKSDEPLPEAPEDVVIAGFDSDEPFNPDDIPF